jgi:hypothetical protein
MVASCVLIGRAAAGDVQPPGNDMPAGLTNWRFNGLQHFPTWQNRL